MGARSEPSDERLLLELHDLFDDLDPVPVSLAEDAKFAIAVAGLEAELAQIVDADLLAVRDRTLPGAAVTLTSSAVSVLIAPSPLPDGTVRLDGWATRPGAEIGAYADPDPLLLQTLDPAAHTTADEFGRFVLEGLRPGRHVFLVRVAEPRHTLLSAPIPLGLERDGDAARP
ncbi:MAG: hypothetical protein V9G19_11785 [Tetrasphaera sp.]